MKTKKLIQKMKGIKTTSLILCAFLAYSQFAMAQRFSDIQIQKEPLVLKSVGSFFVGGESVSQTFEELGGFTPAGHITVNQMYVNYIIPASETVKLPVVMIHGMALTGKTWETTPDGRIGWNEYFARKGHPVFVVDQVARGRSGFNQAIFNNIRNGKGNITEQPVMRRFSDEHGWPNFRIGEKPGESFLDTKYPVDAMNELSKQGVPDLNSTLPNLVFNYKALAELSSQLDGAILMSHSQSGGYPHETALLENANVKAMVIIEPGGIWNNYTDSDLQKLAKIPIVVIFGDYLDVSTGVNHSWRTAYEQYNSFIQKVNAADGKAEMWFLPEKGIRGNSHMLMQDTNHLEIADMIMCWIEKNVTK